MPKFLPQLLYKMLKKRWAKQIKLKIKKINKRMKNNKKRNNKKRNNKKLKDNHLMKKSISPQLL